MLAVLPPSVLILLADLVLALHLGIILFNLFGLIAIPLGAWRGWRFVRRRGWRLLHLLIMAVVALQAVAGRACFLTLWQFALTHAAGAGGSDAPLIRRWVESVIYWPLPPGFFVALYLAVLVYAALLWRWVPPK
jgi:hypothetical protein